MFNVEGFPSVVDLRIWLLFFYNVANFYFVFFVKFVFLKVDVAFLHIFYLFLFFFYKSVARSAPRTCLCEVACKDTKGYQFNWTLAAKQKY